MSSAPLRMADGWLPPDIASMGCWSGHDPRRQEICLTGTISPVPTRISNQRSKDLRFAVVPDDQRPCRSPNRSVPSLLPLTTGCCGGMKTAAANSGTGFQRAVYTADLRSRHPRRRHGDNFDYPDPAGPSGECLVRCLDRFPTVVGGTARFGGRGVKEATPFDRPFLQELYGIHDTLDLSEGNAQTRTP